MDFWRFTSYVPANAIYLIPEHAYQMGWLGMAIAGLAVLSMLPALERAARSQTAQSRYLWVMAGGISLTFGAWATFYTALLGLSLPVTSEFEILDGIEAGLPSMPVFLVAFWILSVREPRAWRLHLAAVLLIVGMTTAELLGFEALKLVAEFNYSPGMLLIGIGQSYGLALGGLFLYVGLRKVQRVPGLVRGLLGSLLLSAAFIGLHFSTVASMTFYQVNKVIAARQLADPSVIPVIAVAVSLLVLPSGLAACSMPALAGWRNRWRPARRAAGRRSTQWPMRTSRRP